MTENPASYNIPPAVQSHFMHGKVFSKAVGGVLSNYRGEIKRKVRSILIPRLYLICFDRSKNRLPRSKTSSPCVRNLQFEAIRLPKSIWNKLPSWYVANKLGVICVIMLMQSCLTAVAHVSHRIQPAQLRPHPTTIVLLGVY